MIIAVGKSRKDTKWHNTDLTWEEFLDRLREPHRSHETVREYRAMSKDEKGRIKDVGGFVGGELLGGRRTSGNVKNRCMVTLDLDNAAQDAWENAAMWGWTCACYSTHSHTNDKPRLRVIFPLSRCVGVEEYQAISRRVGEYVGIEQLDTSTHESCRLMYWPSCSKDGEYVFKEQSGAVLDPDEILRSYGRDDAWKDSRLWPIAKNEAEIRVKEIRKQGDPTEKPGIVGLFCRTYDIHSAIETFLPDIYEEGESGRYTYCSGSTADGAVVYEDGAFLFSHHGTDPCGGKLVNAFDLVRIHLYGDMDEKDITDITKAPSYLKMAELIRNDKGVKQVLFEEASARAEEAFQDLTADDEWVQKLAVDKKGVYLPTVENFRLIMLNDPELKGKIRYSDFDYKIHLVGSLPWSRLDIDRTKEDVDEAGLRWYLEKKWNLVSKGGIADAVELAARDNRYHPVREYLNSLEWDGVERLDTLLIRFLEADDTPFVRTITRKWMVAACKRVFEPGCKFDTMLVVVSPRQGKGKSMFGDTLTGWHGWFQDGVGSLESKDSRQVLMGKWIVEMGEMASTRKATNEVIKQYISCRVDSYRESYGKNSFDHPRQCVFIGSTNNREFIVDETGGRRFWPIEAHAPMETSEARINALAKERDQLWAEAMHRYRAGEKVWIDDPRMMRRAEEEQTRYSQADEWIGMVQDYLDTPLPLDWEERTAEQRRDYIQGLDLTCPRLTEDEPHLIRECVSIAEMRYELLGEDLTRGAGGNHESSRHLGRVMNVMPDWTLAKNPRRTLMFGRQKVYVRAGSAADRSASSEAARAALERWKARTASSTPEQG